MRCIEHQAPTHLRIRPLSLQNAGDACVPMGVITLFDWKNSLGILVRYKDLENKEWKCKGYRTLYAVGGRFGEQGYVGLHSL